MRGCNHSAPWIPLRCRKPAPVGPAPSCRDLNTYQDNGVLKCSSLGVVEPRLPVCTVELHPSGSRGGRAHAVRLGVSRARVALAQLGTHDPDTERLGSRT